MNLSDAWGILDINCNVGSAAVAAIKRGLFWVGMEGNKKYRACIPKYVASMLSKSARVHSYYDSWTENKRMFE